MAVICQTDLFHRTLNEILTVLKSLNSDKNMFKQYINQGQDKDAIQECRQKLQDAHQRFSVSWRCCRCPCDTNEATSSMPLFESNCHLIMDSKLYAYSHLECSVDLLTI